MLVLYSSPGFALCLLEPRHAESLFALVDADRAYFARFQGWPAAMETVEATRNFLRNLAHGFADSGAPYLGIYLDEALVGVIGFNPPLNWTERSGELFYYLAECQQGKGLVTRACRILLDYAFNELHLHRVVIRAAGSNTRSWAIPERLGFHRDGVMRDAKWLGDRYDDHYVYSLLCDEWTAQQAVLQSQEVG